MLPRGRQGLLRAPLRPPLPPLLVLHVGPRHPRPVVLYTATRTMHCSFLRNEGRICAAARFEQDKFRLAVQTRSFAPHFCRVASG